MKQSSLKVQAYEACRLQNLGIQNNNDYKIAQLDAINGYAYNVRCSMHNELFRLYKMQLFHKTLIYGETMKLGTWKCKWADIVKCIC